MKIIKYPSPNFSERTLEVDSIIIHYTDMLSTDETLALFFNPISQVSSHYLIDEEGQIYHLVEEGKKAWHAGTSYWQGRTGLNDYSVGIELANPGHSHGYQPFPEAQIESLLKLCHDIRTRWNIPSSRILGHSDIAPRRKQDPGHLFPWEKLAQEGLGLWPDMSDELKHPGLLSPRQSSPEDSSLWIKALERIGYETISPSQALLAFQRHFQPHKVDGIANDETFALLQGLLKISEKPI